jgi:thymidylate kinase
VDGAGRYDGADQALHQSLRDGFRALVARFPERMVQLDASRSPEAVLSQALQAIKERC